MDNLKESERWMKDAEDCFYRTKRCFDEGDWRGTIQNAQLTIELSCKSVIAIFEEPDWTHKPDIQFYRVVNEHVDEIEERYGKSMLEALYLVAEDIKV